MLFFHSLLHFLVRGVRAGVVDASGQVLDEADSLGDADLLLLCQLAGQAALPRGGVVHWQGLGALLGRGDRETTVEKAS